jgi:glycerophosphoryl diester phosphodiesterase
MRPLVIAHRGASGTRPENTLAAFRQAVTLGADMIELDVQLTRDGEVVVIHDDTLDRTTDGRGPVGGRTLDQLRQLDAGRWFGPAWAGERIPTLAEVLAEIALPVNVELKPAGDDGLEARVLAVIGSAGALGRVVFSSFEADALVRTREMSPDATIAVLWESETISLAHERMERVAATALHLRKDAATPRTLARLQALGVQVRVWTVNDKAEIDRLRAGPVGGFFTDFPERFLQLGAR